MHGKVLYHFDLFSSHMSHAWLLKTKSGRCHITGALAKLIYGHGNLVWLIFGQKWYALASNRNFFAFSSPCGLQLLGIAVQLCRNLVNGDLICQKKMVPQCWETTAEVTKCIKHVMVTEGCRID